MQKNFELRILYVREGVVTRDSSRELSAATQTLMHPFRCLFVVVNNLYAALEQFSIHDFDVVVTQTRFDSDILTILDFERLMDYASDHVVPMVLLVQLHQREEFGNDSQLQRQLQQLQSPYLLVCEERSPDLFLTALCRAIKTLFYQSNGVSTLPPTTGTASAVSSIFENSLDFSQPTAPASVPTAAAVTVITATAATAAAVKAPNRSVRRRTSATPPFADSNLFIECTTTSATAATDAAPTVSTALVTAAAAGDPDLIAIVSDSAAATVDSGVTALLEEPNLLFEDELLQFLSDFAVLPSEAMLLDEPVHDDDGSGFNPHQQRQL